MNWDVLAQELALLAKLTEALALEWEQIEILLPSGSTLVILNGPSGPGG